MRRRSSPGALALALTLAACGGAQPAASWSPAQRAQISSLSIERLAAPPPDPSNAVADHPAAAALGRRLFADARLSANGRISCASCHKPELAFTDGRATAQGLAGVRRNTPSLIGAAWSPWQFWDGRADSLWAQATGPLLHPAEMGMTARAVAAVAATGYAKEYRSVFGSDPAADAQRTLTGVAKALAAYVRTLRPAPARFDAFAEAVAAGRPEADALLEAQERDGLRLFLGKAQCLRCHHGPLLTNHGFHNTGLAPLPGQPPDLGRVLGVQEALASEFNCRGRYSDARDRKCPSLDYVRAGTPELVGAFKTPGLRAVAQTGPYMHDGRFATLHDVLDHYNRAPQLLREQGHTELFALALAPAELDAIEAFLRALSPLAPAAAQD
jgi:cytochrome c peroxidase